MPSTYTLSHPNCCALLSRTWSGFSQRALFCDAHKMAKLLDDLISVPHLQTLVRGVTISPHGYEVDHIPLPAYMSCLASVLSLLRNLAKVVIENDDSEDEAIRAYLDLIPNVLGNAPLVELDINVYSVETIHYVFGILGGTNIKRVGLSGFIDDETPLHLPSLESIHFEVIDLPKEFHNCLTHYFDLPNLKMCEIVIDFVDDLLHWQDVLRRGFPPLKLFKLELGISFTDDVAWSGIPKKIITCPGDLHDLRMVIEWWSSTFRALSDSKATIHFTELTFTLPDLQDVDTLEEAWNSLDESLAHTTFSGVRNIHFESRREGRFVTRVAYSPVLADRMWLVLPRLASRGVLRFV
ncbi:hypothetical protein BDZ89DRAFT_1085799 [Hymenopellis radicata]|nr:hypothetical protein BDZ89DRAFT_1085799 [Hymenopellis radicata]